MMYHTQGDLKLVGITGVATFRGSGGTTDGGKVCFPNLLCKSQSKQGFSITFLIIISWLHLINDVNMLKIITVINYL